MKYIWFFLHCKFFFYFWSSKPWIQMSIHPKMLDPDPDQESETLESVTPTRLPVRTVQVRVFTVENPHHLFTLPESVCLREVLQCAFEIFYIVPLRPVVFLTCWSQCSWSVTFWYWCGCGSSDPYRLLTIGSSRSVPKSLLTSKMQQKSIFHIFNVLIYEI